MTRGYKTITSTSESTTTMAEKSQIPDNNNTTVPSSEKKPAKEIGSGSGQRKSYYNRPESVNPDQATLREQWKFAIRQYSKWYSHAWGTAILAGGVFFGLGWIIKGSNPLPSLQSSSKPPPPGTDEEK